uniref:Putative secreted protein n=1 Tax=Anopheles darlingi TaxID=43151 RepID=A0A2M4DIW9_ANODA
MILCLVCFALIYLFPVQRQQNPTNTERDATVERTTEEMRADQLVKRTRVGRRIETYALPDRNDSLCSERFRQAEASTIPLTPPRHGTHRVNRNKSSQMSQTTLPVVSVGRSVGPIHPSITSQHPRGRVGLR